MRGFFAEKTQISAETTLEVGMENYSVYEDIASRTNGDIYIGVVGPVRTGKSTFIRGLWNSSSFLPPTNPAAR